MPRLETEAYGPFTRRISTRPGSLRLWNDGDLLATWIDQCVPGAIANIAIVVTRASVE